jgi:hypothetical protein
VFFAAVVELLDVELLELLEGAVDADKVEGAEEVDNGIEAGCGTGVEDAITGSCNKSGR